MALSSDARPLTMHTKDQLAAALRDAGLDAMADKAATGHWHDYLSPLALPTLDLLAELAKLRTPAAEAVALRVMKGEFDASQSEAEEWAKTREGREALSWLNRGRK